MKLFIAVTITILGLLGSLTHFAVNNVVKVLDTAEHDITSRFNSGKNVYCKNSVFDSHKIIVSKARGYILINKKLVNPSTDYSYNILPNCSSSAN